MINPARRLAVRIGKFRRLPGSDRNLLLRAAGGIAVIRLGLWFLPYSRLLRLVQNAGPARGVPVATATRIAWAVAAASRFVPRTGGALPQALATLWLLLRNGHPGTLKFLDDEPTLEPRPAVWVESRGAIVIGDRERKRLEQPGARAARVLAAGPETSLLLSCTKKGLPGEDAGQLATLQSGSLDWSRVRHLARIHKLQPFLHRVLPSLPSDAIPDDVRMRIEKRFAKNAARVRLRVEELERILQLFQQRGLRVIVVKGPALAISAYGDVLGRKFGDLDLLVDPVDYARSEALLALEGYEPTKRFAWEVALRNPQREIVVDLHRQIARRMFSIPFQFDGVWQRSEPLYIGGTLGRRLSSHDRLLFLSTKLICDWVEGRCELGRIRDIAQLVCMDSGIEWESLLADARRRGAERLLLASLELARLSLDIELPPAAAERISALDGVAALARRAADELFDPAAGLRYEERVRLYVAQREHVSVRILIHLELARRRLKAWALGLYQARTIDP